VTAQARITQADEERTFKALKAAGVDRARVVLDLNKGTIEVIIGESGDPKPDRNPWDDE